MRGLPNNTPRLRAAPEIFSWNTFSQPAALKRGTLQLEGLVFGGDAGVAEFHAGAPTADTLARHFHLYTADLTLIHALRGKHNRLDFAVMLGSARCLGTFLDQAADIPGRVLHTVSRQLNLPAAVTLEGYFASRHRERHL